MLDSNGLRLQNPHHTLILISLFPKYHSKELISGHESEGT